MIINSKEIGKFTKISRKKRKTPLVATIGTLG